MEKQYGVGVLIQGNRCYRCGNEWINRTETTPKTCPKCRSPYWDRPRKKLIK